MGPKARIAPIKAGSVDGDGVAPLKWPAGLLEGACFESNPFSFNMLRILKSFAFRQKPSLVAAILIWEPGSETEVYPANRVVCS